MPFILIAIILGVALLMPTVVLGYVGGKPVNIQVKSIGAYGCCLRTDAADAWLRMKSDALSDGVVLNPKGPNSAFRTMEQQEDMTMERAAFAAAAGHSPHQEGIAVDVDLTLEGDALGWLQSNGIAYSWFPLTGAGGTKEPWHWEFHA